MYLVASRKCKIIIVVVRASLKLLKYRQELEWCHIQLNTGTCHTWLRFIDTNALEWSAEILLPRILLKLKLISNLDGTFTPKTKLYKYRYTSLNTRNHYYRAASIHRLRRAATYSIICKHKWRNVFIECIRGLANYIMNPSATENVCTRRILIPALDLLWNKVRRHDVRKWAYFCDKYLSADLLCHTQNHHVHKIYSGYNTQHV